MNFFQFIKWLWYSVEKYDSKVLFKIFLVSKATLTKLHRNSISHQQKMFLLDAMHKQNFRHYTELRYTSLIFQPFNSSMFARCLSGNCASWIMNRLVWRSRPFFALFSRSLARKCMEMPANARNIRAEKRGKAGRGMGDNPGSVKRGNSEKRARETELFKLRIIYKTLRGDEYSSVARPRGVLEIMSTYACECTA